MLISYPFLAGQPREDTDPTAPHDLSHLGELTGTGQFPLTQGLDWHGGSHWEAPLSTNGDVEDVRAIADGEVVYARESDGKPARDTDPAIIDAHPLLYYKGWTSNGVVILKHVTEIGEGVDVTFYSIYQHMDTLATVGPAGHTQALKKGDKVYRKNKLGKAGTIYGQTHRIHLEIIADATNAERVMGRSSTPLTAPQGAHVVRVG
ncbi:M23 family metallopeptidase [Dyella terrae]|uniref:M23 family metallopeptidase n=1 Tax=Dyella terrae TaxID=522259 RepID=UPI001EFD4102|nr:M23 family metallopeptidase [Dyella terrae]ULU24702.1 hypothetical protein DYST_01622 [Dyella terrae]